MHQYKKLDFWQRSCTLCEVIYKETTSFPESERFGLTNQIRRAAVSIPSNIAEGASRPTNKDFQRFLSISLGSAFEMETQLYLAKQLDFMDTNVFDSLNRDLEIIIRQIRKFKSTLV